MKLKEKIMQELQTALINLLIVFIGVLTTYLSQQATIFLKKNGVLKELEGKKAYAKIVVNAIQQTYTEADGEAKFNDAKAQLVRVLNENGLTFTDTELNSLIESAVHGIKEGVTSAK